MDVTPSMPPASGLSVLRLWNTESRRPDLALKQGFSLPPSLFPNWGNPHPQ